MFLENFHSRLRGEGESTGSDIEERTHLKSVDNAYDVVAASIRAHRPVYLAELSQLQWHPTVKADVLKT